MTSSSASNLPCPNWVFSNTSNVHVCKDRSWFTEYTPFESSVGSIYFDAQKIPVAGVGVVVLPVKRRPNRTGSDAHGQLLLHSILHCPSILCNIIGKTPQFQANYVIDFRWGQTGKSKGTIQDHHGRFVAYFAPNKRLFQVQLSGPPVGPAVGPSVLEGDEPLLLNVKWSEGEQARWETYKQNCSGPLAIMQTNNGTAKDQPEQSRIQQQPKISNIHQQSSPPYTADEKQWITTYYGNEYRFLLVHGLSIYKDEDREEGREIVRALMLKDGPWAKSYPEGSALGKKNDNSDHASEDSDEDYEESMADHLFDEKSLRMIKTYYGTSMNFMHSFGLRIYELDDWNEAQAIANEMMKDDKYH
ncbi:hypothetical protein DV736_g2624, partial [Chaetothyriales sp. CBS 134916]